MIIVSLLAAVVAVTLLVPPPLARSFKRLGHDPPAVQKEPSAALPVVLWVVAAGASVALAGATRGAAGAAVITAGVLALGTTSWLLVRHRARRCAGRARADVAHACASMAAQLRVGRVPTEALAVTAADHPVLEVVSRTAAMGGDVVGTLRGQAQLPGHQGLADLAQAWQLAGDTGAPMSAVLEQVAKSLRADLAVQRTVSAELAGPRASGKVMAVLPLGGVGMGYLLGGDPLAFMLAGPIGWFCLVGGVGLACAGVLWIDQLARTVEAG